MMLYLLLLRAQVRSQLRYPTAFALDALGSLLITAAEFAAFALVLPRFGALAGATGGSWTLGEIAVLYGLAELSFVIMDLIFGGFDAPNLSAHVRAGSFSTFLLRPAPLILQVFGSDFALRRLTRVGLGAWILAYGLGHTAHAWTVQDALLLTLSGLGMVCFFGGLFVVGGTLSFWTVQNIEAMNILTYGGRTLISYPLDIYDRWLRRAATFLLPAAFLSYLPLMHLLGRPLPGGLPDWAAWLSLPVGLGLLALAFWFWSVGVRRYVGTGT